MTPPGGPDSDPDPRSVPDDPNADLASLGIRETGSTPRADVATDPLRNRTTESGGGSSGLFVRGSSKGSNVLLRLVDGIVYLVGAALVLGLGYGAWHYAPRMLGGFFGGGEGGAVATLDVPEGAIGCRPGTLDAAPDPALRSAPSVVLGAARLPRGADTLEAIGASSTRRDGDRIDVFRPGAARMLVRYRGEGAAVRRITVSFDAPPAFCAAMARLSLLPAPAAFDVAADGAVRPVAGEPHAFFEQGTLRVQGTPEAIELMRLEP